MAREQPVNLKQREANDPVGTALESIGEEPCGSLESVRAGLIVGIARPDVPRNPLLGRFIDHDIGAVHDGVDNRLPMLSDQRNRHTGVDLVGAAGQGAEHGRRLVAIVGLAENGPVERNRRVRSKNNPSGAERGAGLVDRHSLDIVDGSLSRLRSLIDRCGLNGRENADSAQQFAAARRPGGEDQAEIGHEASLACPIQRATRCRSSASTLRAIDTPEPPELDPTTPQAVDEVRELPSSLPAATDEEIRPDSFIVTTGFFRAGTDPIRLPKAVEGPLYTPEQASMAAHEFFRALAGDRELLEHHEDPVEHARANGLMMLFSHGVAEVFETHLARMEPDLQGRWRDLIAGGARSEAFGPLTLQERLDERSVEQALVTGRRQRVVNLLVGVVLLGAVGAAAWWGWQEYGVQEERTQGALQFGEVDDGVDAEATAGGPPVAEPLLTTVLADTVSVLAGEGPVADRVTVAPFARYPYPPGALGASVFQYANAGHVVIIGPPGFADLACLRVSVVTSDLRPLDTVTHGPCGDPVGRLATVGCRGTDAILLALDIPSGTVDLPEGGTGFADAIRLQLVADGAPEYEVLSIRGTIQVDPDSGVTIPRFGGEVGESITFDIGSGRVGTCILTGELPSGA